MPIPFEKLAKLDLKMLRTLLILIKTKNVSHTAEQLDLQQSTVSYQLGKLREFLDDPLLIRSGRGLEPTTFARQIEPTLTAQLDAMENLLFGRVFDEKSAVGTIKMACHRNGSQDFMSKLLHAVSMRLPNIHLEIIDWNDSVVSDLKESKLDFAIGFVPENCSQIQSVPLVEVTYQIVMCANHSKAAIGLQEGEIFNYPHVVLNTNDNVERWIEYLRGKQGKQRQVVFSASSMEFATMALSETDRILFSANTNDDFFSQYAVVSKPVSYIPRQTFCLLFHERVNTDPLRSVFKQIVEDAGNQVFS
ncbi:transcriptional regulator [Vibrio tubiashii ATCC 19109]|uniref:Transcriptional regulator n=1 Tax=Vibrio tubiashii ATCC 19109 TaxID=1051646 RepID=F9T9M4_9VIBR|nr:LysR family transcriptional regulator [Vibrio tubiashii]AIW15617.1 transcriptional regulator [Vibrio tubiashii ATCC 19109]EGU51197.1 transcriptional regulator, LysR family protein [Vibrio tubiashii ATCC 19109]